jgi:hypothetical protein
MHGVLSRNGQAAVTSRLFFPPTLTTRNGVNVYRI